MSDQAPERHKLRDGTVTFDRRLDRCREFDERSRDYPLQLTRAPEWANKVWMLRRQYYGDQKWEGACVEFGITHELASQPIVVPVPKLQVIRSKHLIYYPAQQRDPWPGGSYPGADPFYEGTSVLSGLKVATELGFYSGFRWTFNMDGHVNGVLADGPAVIGIEMTEGMMSTDPAGLMKDEGSEVGGHCMAWIGCLFGHKLTKQHKKMDLAVLPQSWGLGFGDRGRVYMELGELENRLKAGGEVAHPQRNQKEAWSV